MREPARRRLNPVRRREELITAASALFEAVPYDQLTIDEIAERCGVSVGLLYHHFESKRGLYIACLDASIDRFLRAIRDPGPSVPLERRVTEAIDSYLDFVVEHPRSYRALLRGGIGTDDDVHARIQAARERFSELILRGLGIDQPPKEFILRLWGWMGFVEAACSRWLQSPELERERLRDVLVESALATFSGRAAAAT